MLALIDYGIGNLRSVQKALEHVGAEVTLTSDADVIQRATKVVLPGVGAFGDGVKGMQARGLVEVVKEVIRVGTPLLGICVGMQLLFEESEEMGRYDGLGILRGCVKKFPTDMRERPTASGVGVVRDPLVEDKRPPLLKVPQTGWNEIVVRQPSPLFHELSSGSFAYFNHSYYCAASEPDILATTDYGFDFPSIVGQGRVYGIQFHPEKSQSVGLRLLRNFVEGG